MSTDKPKMVRRSLNWVAFVVSFVLALAAFVGLRVVHGYRLKQTAGELLTLAQQQEDNSEWLKAAEYLDRYLHLRSTDVKVRGRMALDFGRFAKDAKTWMPKQQAIDLHYRALAGGDESQAIELRLSLLDLLIEHGRFPEAEKEAKRVLDVEPDNARAVRALAISLATQLADGSIAATTSKDQKIVKTIEKARKLNPSDARLATILAVVLREYPLVVQAEYPGTAERERHLRADDNFDEFVEQNSTSAAAYLARSAYRAKYKLPNAAKDLEAAGRLAPDDPEVLLASAVAAFDEARRLSATRADEGQRKAQLELAKTFFQKLVDAPPQQQIEQSYLGLGDTYFITGDYDKAVEIWQQALVKFRQTTTLIVLHSRIAEAAIDRDQLKLAGESLDAIDQLLGKLGGSIGRDEKLVLTRGQDLRRASWHIKRQNVSAAMPLLRQVVTSQSKSDKNVQPTFRAWMHMGTISAAQGEWMDAATSFDQAGALEPSAVSPRLAASTSWLYAGRADMASERAEQALQHTTGVEAWLALALSQVQQQAQLPPAQRTWQRLEKALAVLESAKWQLAEPWRVDFVRVEQAVTRAKASNNQQAGVEEAIKLLKPTEQQYGSNKTFWAQLAVVYQTLNRADDAQRSLAALRKSGGSESEIVLVEARLASLRGDHSKAQAVLQEGLKTVAQQFEQRMRDELLTATLMVKDAAQARTMLLNEHRLHPQHVGVIRKLAELDLEQKNLTSVRDWEAKLIAIGPLGEPYARYFRAWRLYLTASGDKDSQLHDSLRELEQAMLVRANWAEASTLKGAVEQRLGRKEQAVAAYERAIQLGERRIHVYEQLIGLLDALKRTADVDRYLARLETEIPLSQRLAEMAMAQQIRRERPEQALEIAKSRAKQRPDDPVAQLWLGRLLVIANKWQDAEAPLKRACELSPPDARFWNALIDCYLRSRRPEKIEQAIDQLAANDSLDPVQKSILVARCHEALGNRAEAEKHYQNASQAAPSDVSLQLRIAQYYLQSNPEQAKSHLEAALKQEPTSVAGKQMLAIVHAALGEMNEAASLLSVASVDGTVAADDMRLSALLLLQRGGEANLSLAAAKLEELVGRETAIAKDQFTDRMLLSRLYEQQARLARNSDAREERLAAAESQLKSMAEHSAATPSHLAALIQFYLRLERKQDASTWLEQLERQVENMPSDDPAMMHLVARLWLEQGTPRRVEKWIEKLAKIDTTPLRSIARKAQHALANDQQADIAAIIEPKATEMFQSAAAGEERLAISGAVGDLYFSLRKDLDAERWYRQLQTEDATRYTSLVRALQRQGKIRDAIAQCRAATNADSSVQPYLMLSNVLIEGKPTPADFDYAEDMLSEAVKKHESDPRMLYALGLVRVMQKRDADSITLFKRVVDASPRSIPALNNLAMLLADIPVERPEALKLIDQAIDFAGEDASLLDTKGAILLYSGRSAEAVPILELATREPAADPRHHFHLALAYRDQGNIEDAKRQLQTALERELVSQVLTNTDQQLLAELRTALKL